MVFAFRYTTGTPVFLLVFISVLLCRCTSPCFKEIIHKTEINLMLLLMFSAHNLSFLSSCKGFKIQEAFTFMGDIISTIF